MVVKYGRYLRKMTDSSTTVDQPEQVEVDVVGSDLVEEASLKDNPLTETNDNSDKESKPDAEIEATPLVSAPPPVTEDQPLREFRYANPHGTFITGIDVNSEEAALKRSQRAARFGVSKDSEEGEGGVKDEETVERRQARAKRFGTKLIAYKGEAVKLVDELPEIPTGDLRPEVIHLHGTNEMSTKDVFAYFQSYAPRNIEWINDSSCNAVWEDAESAFRALHGLTTQPVELRSKFTEDSQPMETDYSSNEMGSGATRERAVTPQSGVAEENETNAQSQANGKNRVPGESVGTATTAEEGGADVEVESKAVEQRGGQREVQWRLGLAHPNAKQLLLRYAFGGDQKVAGASRQSNYYRKYGNPNKKYTWKSGSKSQERLTSSNSSGSERTLRERPAAQDLRRRLGKRSREIEEEVVESMDTREDSVVAPDPLASLVKRPKPLHSERMVEEVEERRFLDDSEKERMEEAVVIGEADLRKKLQKNRRRRDLKLRVGHNPRLVERTD